MDEFQVAQHPEVQTGGGREGEVREDSEHPSRPADGRRTRLFFCNRH